MMLALALLAALGVAAPKSEIEVLADSALGAPPELAADALIRIAARGPGQVRID